MGTLRVVLLTDTSINTTYHAGATSGMQNELSEMKASVACLLRKMDALHRIQDERETSGKAGRPQTGRRLAWPDETSCGWPRMRFGART